MQMQIQSPNPVNCSLLREGLKKILKKFLEVEFLLFVLIRDNSSTVVRAYIKHDSEIFQNNYQDNIRIFNQIIERISPVFQNFSRNYNYRAFM